jgi:CRP-like cAMP-binding protein
MVSILGQFKVNRQLTFPKMPSDFFNHNIGQIYEEGDPVEYLYLVREGVVKEQFSGKRFYRKTKGAMLNIANICAPDETCLTTLTALSDCQLYKIRKRKNFIETFSGPI